MTELSLAQPPRFGRLQRLHELLEPGTHPGGIGPLEGDPHAVGVDPRLPDEAIEIQAAPREREGPLVPMAPDPVVGARVPDQHVRPFDRARTVLSNGAIADSAACGPVLSSLNQ